jgi:SpoVK/Ycf46/Vps4 family AAA+-type ATPase
MVSGDLLRQLFKSYASRDDAAFRAAAQEVIQEERLKNHRLLADDLERILRNGRSAAQLRPAPALDAPTDRERGAALIEVQHPDLSWDDLVLAPEVFTVLRRIVDENRRRDVLAGSGLHPANRILFYGPPGCGKSLSAHVLAAELGRPLAIVRFDAVVSSYLGETAANLRKVFDFVHGDEWVVLFDEFDAIGKDRDNPFEHGELKRVVNSLLQLLDGYKGESLMIAATNHEGLLDDAVWRRFDTVVSFPVPTQQDRVLLLRHYLRGFDASAVSLPTLAKRLPEATGSDIERLAVQAAKSAVLDGRTQLVRHDFEGPVRALRARQQLLSRSKGSNGQKTRPRRQSKTGG